jgi:hypothetical protein
MKIKATPVAPIEAPAMPVTTAPTPLVVVSVLLDAANGVVVVFDDEFTAAVGVGENGMATGVGVAGVEVMVARGLGLGVGDGG